MKIVKKINNNVVIGLDGNGHEVIAIGKGLGFTQIPYDLTDLSKIDRTFYGIDDKYYGLLKDIPKEVFNLVAKLVDFSKNKINSELNPNLVFILADHINFAIERQKKNLDITLPYSYELEYEYPEINKLAKWFLKNIKEKLGIDLPKGEITSISMHLINAMEGKMVNKEKDISSKIIVQVTKLIENFFKIEIDKSSFNYFRFKNHIKYFVQRKKIDEQFNDANEELFEAMKKSYPDTHKCIYLIDDYFYKVFNKHCTKEELLYLMVHVTRLYIKEDCNRKGIT